MTTSCSRCGLLHPEGTPCFALALPETRATRELQPGVLLAGRYLLLRTIHHGGMSVVYLADDTVQNRQVAIKELRLPDGASDEETHEAEAWFARESYLLSTLEHPLIPRFYSVFREEQRSYLVQEYVGGENLEQLVSSEGPLREELVVRWARDLCDLLDYLHNRPEPVIFRDLKPANMLLRDVDQSLVVVDFGIARPYLEGQVGTVVGTPGYAPPEQYQGLATPQSDIYALGATMHRLLTGYDPEHAAAPFSFPAVTESNAGISPAVAAVVEQALALNPAERFESALAMNEALEKTRAWPLGDRLRAGWAGSRRGRAAGAGTMGRRLWSGLAVAAVLAPLLLRAAAGTQMSTPDSYSYANDRNFSLVNDMMLCAPMGISTAAPGTQLMPGNQLVISGGNLWFTDQHGVSLDYLTATGQVGSCIVSTPSPVPRDMSSDGLGNIWILQADGANIVQVTPESPLQQYTLPPNTKAARLAVTEDGALWFTQPASHSVSRVDSAGNIQQFTLPSAQGTPQAISAAGTSVWVSESGNQVSHVTAQGAIKSITLPQQAAGASAIAAGVDGSAWITATAANRIDHVLQNGTIDSYIVPSPHAGLGAITVAPDQSVWFVEQRANRIGRMGVDGSIQEFAIPTANSQPTAITVGPDGVVWFTEHNNPALGRIDATGKVSEIPTMAGTNAALDGSLRGMSTPYLSAATSPTK